VPRDQTLCACCRPALSGGSRHVRQKGTGPVCGTATTLQPFVKSFCGWPIDCPSVEGSCPAEGHHNLKDLGHLCASARSSSCRLAYSVLTVSSFRIEPPPAEVLSPARDDQSPRSGPSPSRPNLGCFGCVRLPWTTALRLSLHPEQTTPGTLAPVLNPAASNTHDNWVWGTGSLPMVRATPAVKRHGVHHEATFSTG